MRHHLNALSNLYRRAQAEGFVTPGYNPVAALLEKPSAEHHEARWLGSTRQRSCSRRPRAVALVSPWIVARELRYSSRKMINQPYGHPGRGRHRSEVVEYRIDQQRDNLGSRLDQ